MTYERTETRRHEEDRQVNLDRRSTGARGERVPVSSVELFVRRAAVLLLVVVAITQLWHAFRSPEPTLAAYSDQVVWTCIGEEWSGRGANCVAWPAPPLERE